MGKSLWIVPALFLIMAVGSHTANADTFNTTISGADTGTIVFTTPSSASGGLITAVSGTFDGATISGLLPTGSLGGNDNLFYNPANPAYFDYSGVSFSLASIDSAGYAYANLFYGGSGYGYESYQCQGGTDACWGATFGPDTVVDPVATPEPGTLTLLLIGIGLLGMTMLMQKFAGQGFGVPADRDAQSDGQFTSGRQQCPPATHCPC